MILVQKINKSGIQRYNDIINDLDFFSRFKFTIKGPNALGGKNANNISVRYRGLHHSFLGHIDLTVCGNSDPGTSGLLTPYSEMDGLYFDSDMEPDNFLFDFKKKVKDVIKNQGAAYVSVDFDNKKDYYAMMNAMETWNEENLSVITTSDENDLRIIVMDEIDLDSREPRNAPPTRKKK